MARIRTIKPEFWTDEIIVKLPFEARLLFIGLWNFADDTGALDYSPDRVAMQILPGDPNLDISSLIDLLNAAGLIDYWVTDDGDKAITIRNWGKHQKIDNPSKKTILGESYRKLAIPIESRIALAKKYGCLPGQSIEANCYYCGATGIISWYNRNGRAMRWVHFSELEIDHFVPEKKGGENNHTNLVLACRTCNRKKGHEDSKEFFGVKNPTVVLASPIEPSPLEGNGKEWKGKEKEKTRKKKKAVDPNLKTQALEVLRFLNLKAGREYREVDTNLGFISARLESGVSVDDCRAIIAKKCREWKSDPKMDLYLRPATLFNKTKFEQYVGELLPEEKPDAQ